VNAFSEEVGHFDLSIMGGADLISYVNVVSSDQGALLSQSGGSPAIVNGAGGHVGVGFRLFFSPLVALRVEVKDYIYPVSIPNLGTNKQIENQLFTELGVSFLLPRQSRTQAQ
jgi:outer membrane beta-barrel protein